MTSKYVYSFLFFFSSRRRHTRCLSDWSSDVCSSDLIVITGASDGIGAELARQLSDAGTALVLAARNTEKLEQIAGQCRAKETRSEERRVGKECRSRWSPYEQR